MTRWPLISRFVIALGVGLGACSSSSDGLLSQVNLAGQASEMCDSGGSPHGNRRIERVASGLRPVHAGSLSSGQIGYDEEEGHFAAGSHPTSLFDTGD